MGVALRRCEVRDRDAVAGILTRAGNFTAAEIDTALELIDEWLEFGEDSGYVTYVLDDDGVRGYVCFGPVPLTDGTFDLYWIAVESAAQGRGYGQQLIRLAEREAQARGARQLLIETSSQQTYEGTSRFYERAGYSLVARFPAFYKPGDDKLVYGKVLAASS